MRTAAASVLFLLAAAAAAAQDAAKPEPPLETLPVGDLVRGLPFRPAPLPVSILPMETTAYGRAAAGCFCVPEEPDAGALPLVEADDLGDLVVAMLDGEDLAVSGMEGDFFQVPAPRAPAVREALARLRNLRPRSLALAYAIEVADSGGWKTLLAGTEPILPGVRAVFVEADEGTFLADYDVEIAQDSQLPDPIVAVRRTGASLDLRVSPLPGGRAAVVEAVARASSPLPREEAPLGYASMGALDRGAVLGAQAALLFRAEPGRESVHGWTGRDGRFLRLRTTVSWTPSGEDRGPATLLWSPLFQMDPPHRRYTGHLLVPAGAEADELSARYGRAEEGGRPPVEDRVERVRGRLKEGGSVRGDANAGGLLLLGGADAAFAGREIAADMDREFSNAVVEVEARQAGEGGRILFAASGPVVAGTDVNFVSGEARHYVKDWDVEVAQGSWIPDPVVDCLQTGDYLNLRVVAGEDGSPAAVDLDLQMALFKGFESQDLPILDAMDRSGGSPSGTAAGSPKWTVHRVEKPAVREVRIAGRYPLGADGTVTLRRTAPGFLGQGGEIVLVVKVKKP